MHDYNLGATRALISMGMLRLRVPNAAHERAQLVAIDGRSGAGVGLLESHDAPVVASIVP